MTEQAGYPLPFRFDDVAALLGRTGEAESRPAEPSWPDVMADFARLGLPAGTAVIIAMANGKSLLSIYFAALLAGAVPLTISPATSADRIAELSRRIGAGAIVGTRIDSARYGLDTAVPVGRAQAAIFPESGRRSYPAGTVLMGTSGTSGIFSACLHEAGSLARNARRHAGAVGLGAADTILVNLPLYYSYAIVAQAFAALVTGARLILSGPPFSPAAYLAVLGQHGVTATSVTPAIARQLLARRFRAPPRLRMISVGGDHLESGYVPRLLSAAPAAELYVTYGLTEAGPRVSTFAAHAEPPHRYGSVGLPLPGVGATLRPCASAEGDASELVVTSDTVMLAKLGAHGAGRSLLSPGTVATGDLFRIDDGYLYFEGRISDVIVVRGEKLSLSAVRAFIQSLPQVVSCATTVGTDDAGEQYFDLDVYVTDGLSQTENEVTRAVRSFLMRGERPRNISVRQLEHATFRK
jgi:long-chain acyl-CoA synthetase